uniref:Uncharacterized protein n=1 Tax=Varanus komodoensis TaxID=61221 RepID=A0A8D2LGJ1_VARKO
MSGRRWALAAPPTSRTLGVNARKRSWKLTVPKVLVHPQVQLCMEVLGRAGPCAHASARAGSVTSSCLRPRFSSPNKAPCINSEVCPTGSTRTYSPIRLGL